MCSIIRTKLTADQFDQVMQNLKAALIGNINDEFNVSYYLNKRSHKVETHSHFGNATVEDENLEHLHTSTPHDFCAIRDSLREDLSQEEKEFCDQNNFLAIWEGKEDEFTIEDFYAHEDKFFDYDKTWSQQFEIVEVGSLTRKERIVDELISELQKELEAMRPAGATEIDDLLGIDHKDPAKPVTNLLSKWNFAERVKSKLAYEKQMVEWEEAGYPE